MVGRRAALSAPADARLEPGTILIAAGSPESIQRLNEMARPIRHEGPLVIAGYGDVGRTLAEYLTDAGEDVCVIDAESHPGVDVVGDALESDVLERASVKTARGVILALGSDSATLFAAKIVRDFAPDVPIVAGVVLAENVKRIQHAGADFALSVGQVAGQLLAHHVLGETVSLQPRIKLVKVRPGPLEGKSPVEARIRERTGCSVVAVERGDEVVMEFPPTFELRADDAIYLCGTNNAVDRYHDEFYASRL